MEGKIFSSGKKKAIGLIHKVYVTNLKNIKKYTASTQTRAEVRGGGRKPWKQKGTGNARAGSNRSPLWVGGGVIFGPKPRFITKKINKKENKLALFSAFLLKQKQFIFVAEGTFEQLEIKKTKEIYSLLQTLNAFSTENKTKQEKVLIVLKKTNPLLWIASRNLKNISLSTISCLSLTQLLRADKIILSFSCLDLINNFYGK